MTDPIFLPSPDFFLPVPLVVLLHLFSCLSSRSFPSFSTPTSQKPPDIFFLICPCFSCIESHTPYYSFDNSFLYVFVQIFAELLLHLVEGILSHTNSYLDFCLASAITCDVGS